MGDIWSDLWGDALSCDGRPRADAPVTEGEWLYRLDTKLNAIHAMLTELLKQDRG